MKTINRGYWGIGIYHPKTEANIGTLWRSAYSFGANFLFTVGRRYKPQNSDTCKSPLHIPLYHYDSIDDLIKHLPNACPLIGVETDNNSHQLNNYIPLERACYMLGAEDHGLPPNIISRCHHLVNIPYAKHCLNVAVAGSILMYKIKEKINEHK